MVGIVLPAMLPGVPWWVYSLPTMPPYPASLGTPLYILPLPSSVPLHQVVRGVP